MEPKDKIQEISAERSGLRQEIITAEQAVHHCVFAGVAASAILAGIYWNPNLLTQPDARVFVLAVMSQLVFFLVAFAMLNIAAINGVADYIAALEHKINQLAEDKITVWESKIVLETIWHIKSPAFWVAVLVNFWLLCLFVVSSILALREVSNPFFILLFVIETLIVVLLLCWTQSYRKRARQIMFKELGLVNQLQVEPKDVKGAQQTVGGDSGTRDAFAARPRCGDVDKKTQIL